MDEDRSQKANIPSHAFRGASPFGDSEIDRQLFRGRGEEARGLASQILTSPLVVLFGQSGLGKTSLINAALLPLLREERCFPVVVRLVMCQGEFTDEMSAAPSRCDIAQSVIAQIKAAAAAQNVDLQSELDAADLWSFFSSQRCRKDGNALRPVLIIDQFEQLFHWFDRQSKDAFIGQLADVAANRVPEARRREAEQRLADKTFGSKEEEEQTVRLAYGEIGHNARILLSIRDDALPRLDELKDRIPTIFRTTFRLLPLHRRQARDVIKLPPQQIREPFSFSDHAVDEILDFLQRRAEPTGLFASWRRKAPSAATADADLSQEGVDPLMLQILCQGLDNERQGRSKPDQAQITAENVGGPDHLRSILKSYYDRVIRSLPPVRLGWNARRRLPSWSNFLIVNFPRSAAYFLCERGLITRSGQRNTVELNHVEEIYGVPRSDLRVLVQSYLLRTEPRRELTLFELSRDRLAAVLMPIGYWRAFVKNAMLLLTMLAGVGVSSYLIADQNYRKRLAEIEIRDRERLATLQKERELARRREMQERSRNIKNDRTSTGEKKAETIKWMLANSLPPDYSDANGDFAGMPMEKLDLAKANGYGPDFRTTLMRGVILDDATLPKALFMNATFGSEEGDTTSMKRAILSDSRFDMAVIHSADFTSADLARTAFTRAKLVNVNMKDADLRNASFDNARIDLDRTKFNGSSWWLAKGFSRPTRNALAIKYPNAVGDFKVSATYRKELTERGEFIDKAKKENDQRRLIEGLKDFAWILVTFGDESGQAREKLEEARNRAKELNDPFDQQSYAQEIYDIFSLIHMRENSLEQALESIKQMESAERHQASSVTKRLTKSQQDGEWHYRYALILAGLGRAEEAKAKRVESENLGYEPTYELLLLKERVAALEQLN